MTLDLSPLSNAIARLGEGLCRHRQAPEDELLRDGLIQRFEFTYELSHKMLKRYLRQVSASPDQFDGMPFQELIRTGNEQGLLRGEWSDWRRFREMRAQASYVHNEGIATQVVAGIPDFLDEAIRLRDALRLRLDKSALIA
jgi:nucleotidyltransferase substrate binding protein (TIGR01987 family)